MKSMNRHHDRRGASLLIVLIMAAVFVVVIGGAAEYTLAQMRFAQERVDRELAFTIADAGANYYRWHLAHVQNDYKDGTGNPGPYVHEYKDAAGKVIGSFSLDITPPASGSTVVTVKSTGWSSRRPKFKRSVEVKFGIPSFSKYAVAADDVMRFGEGTIVYGPIHSNKGIRFDGTAYNLVSSSVAAYDDPDHDDTDSPEHVWHPDVKQEFGVHTHRNAPPTGGTNNNFRPLEGPPSTLQSRPDIFAAGRTLSVVPIDFPGITVSLSDMKAKATASGIWRSGSGVRGYHVKFNTNDTVDITQVDSLSTCEYRSGGTWINYSSIFSIQSESAFTYKGVSSLNLPLPANGIIFLEDDVWVDGAIDGARVTVVAAREPLASGSATIIVNNNLTYAHTDGTDAIGLIAQKDVSVGFFSANDLRIDAAMIAQKGRAGRYYYRPHALSYRPNGCKNNIYRNSLTLNGAIATSQRYGFAYTDGTGYNTRNLNFDNNLVYAPPPYFPTTGQYTILSWEEKQ